MTTNITIDDTRVADFVISKIDNSIKQWFNAYQGSCHAQHHFPCCTSIASIDNTRIVISKTIVLHSKGVGILIHRYATLHVSNSLMAHSKINCIVYASSDLTDTCTSTTILNTEIMFGQGSEFKLASGLNLILRSVSVTARKQLDNTTITNVTFTNNRKSHGNFYLLIYRGPECKFVTVQIIINKISVISKTSTPGIVIDYIIFDRHPIRLQRTKYNTLWTSCTKASRNMKLVTVKIQKSYFEGSCIVLQNLRSIANEYFNFMINSVKINASMCPVALVLNKTVSRPLFDNLLIPTDTVFTKGTLLQIKGIVIIKSYNIMFVHGLNAAPLRVEFTGNTLFTENQGSVVVTRGMVKFRRNTQIFSNHANEYESTFLIKESSTVSFLGNTTFMNNRGRQGGAISAHGSRLTFQGRANFFGNIAKTVGGGISLKEGSKVFLDNVTNINYYKNEAKEYGGGIYVEEILLWEQKKAIKCFIGITETTMPYGNISVVFESNTAGLAGKALFGGWIDICIPEAYSVRPSQFLIFIKSHSVGYIYVDSDVSSNASRVCICENSTPRMDISTVNIDSGTEVWSGTSSCQGGISKS